MASIRKRGDKWQVQIRRQGMLPVSRTFSLRDDARRWARQIESEADRHGVIADRRQLRRLTLASLIVRYRDQIVPEKRGRDIEKVILNAFLRHPLARHVLADISSAMFSAYRDERLKRVKPVTLRRELGILHNMFEVAQHDWGIPLTTNPLSGFSRGLLGEARTRRVADHEAALLSSAADKCRNRLIMPLVELAIATGMRRGELLRAQWSDIDRQKRTLHVLQTKNGYPRRIALSSAALLIIDALPRNNERLFPLSANAVRLAWGRLANRAGLVDLHFHDLRHEAISRFFERGLSVPEVALISGHRDVRMLFRYTHLKPEDVAAKLG
jgi:integrase